MPTHQHELFYEFHQRAPRAPSEHPGQRGSGLAGDASVEDPPKGSRSMRERHLERVLRELPQDFGFEGDCMFEGELAALLDDFAIAIIPRKMA